MSNRLHKVGVLLVDDNADSLELLKMCLEMEGAEVRTAACARDAYAVFEHWVPDALVSDLGLPDEHGCTMLETIRERFNWRRCGAIALTGHTDAATRTSAERAGFDRYVVKPVSLAELTATVAALAASDQGSAEQPSN